MVSDIMQACVVLARYEYAMEIDRNEHLLPLAGPMHAAQFLHTASVAPRKFSSIELRTYIKFNKFILGSFSLIYFKKSKLPK